MWTQLNISIFTILTWYQGVYTDNNITRDLYRHIGFFELPFVFICFRLVALVILIPNQWSTGWVSEIFCIYSINSSIFSGGWWGSGSLRGTRLPLSRLCWCWLTTGWQRGWTQRCSDTSLTPRITPAIAQSKSSNPGNINPELFVMLLPKYLKTKAFQEILAKFSHCNFRTNIFMEGV